MRPGRGHVGALPRLQLSRRGLGPLSRAVTNYRADERSVPTQRDWFCACPGGRALRGRGRGRGPAWVPRGPRAPWAEPLGPWVLTSPAFSCPLCLPLAAAHAGPSAGARHRGWSTRGGTPAACSLHPAADVSATPPPSPDVRPEPAAAGGQASKSPPPLGGVRPHRRRPRARLAGARPFIERAVPLPRVWRFCGHPPTTPSLGRNVLNRHR